MQVSCHNMFSNLYCKWNVQKREWGNSSCLGSYETVKHNWKILSLCCFILRLGRDSHISASHKQVIWIITTDGISPGVPYPDVLKHAVMRPVHWNPPDGVTRENRHIKAGCRQRSRGETGGLLFRALVRDQQGTLFMLRVHCSQCSFHLAVLVLLLWWRETVEFSSF